MIDISIERYRKIGTERERERERKRERERDEESVREREMKREGQLERERLYRRLVTNYARCNWTRLMKINCYGFQAWKP